MFGTGLSNHDFGRQSRVDRAEQFREFYLLVFFFSCTLPAYHQDLFRGLVIPSYKVFRPGGNGTCLTEHVRLRSENIIQCNTNINPKNE